jgi:uncharacterized protein (UPF0303 family)
MELKANFSAYQLLQEEQKLIFTSLDNAGAILIGEIAKSLGQSRELPIAIQVRLLNWTVYHVSLPGSSIENNQWLDRKARVVNLKHHSTFYERISAEERGVNWHHENNLSKVTHAIHGGGFPLITGDRKFLGALLISGLPQVQDHLLAVETLSNLGLW